MKFDKVIGPFLFLSRKERNGGIVLLFLIGVLIIVRLLIPLFLSSSPVGISIKSTSEFEDLINDTIKDVNEILSKEGNAHLQKEKLTQGGNEGEQRNNKPHIFDPNTVSYDELLIIGFSPYAAKNLINYRNKGGVFHSTNDVKKIYGVDSIFYIKISNYIKITKPGKETKLLDINKADTLAFLGLRGIGPVFARRICKYRDQLGGFISVEQLKEVYQLPEDTYNGIVNKLIVGDESVQKMNINFVGLEELKKHPYCKYENARKIIDYRSSHGYIKKLDNLVVDSVINSETYERLSPYLKIE